MVHPPQRSTMSASLGYLMFVTAVQIASGADELRNYMVMAPRVLRRGLSEPVSVRLFGEAREAAVNVTVELLASSRHHRNLVQPLGAVSRMVAITPTGNTTTMLLPVGPAELHRHRRWDYKLRVTGRTGKVQLFGETQIVDVLDKSFSAFLELNKQVYQPGQEVYIRAIFVDRNLKPVELERVNIVVSDIHGFEAMSWNSLRSPDGLITKSLKLAKAVLEGEWTVTVFVDDEQIQEATFYVLTLERPKFHVKISMKTGSYLTTSDSSVKGAVSAEYRDGRPVKGRVDLYMTIFGIGEHSFTSQIEGKQDFDIPLSAVGLKWLPRKATLLLGARVTEDVTSRSENSSYVIIPMSRVPLKLAFLPSSNKYFKPGLPVYGQIAVVTPDGSPAELTRVVISAFADGDRIASITRKSSHGVISYAFDVPLGVEELHIEATAPNSARPSKYGFAFAEDERTVYMKMWHWNSPSARAIRIVPPDDKLGVDREAGIEVLSSHRLGNLFMEIISRGQTVQSTTIPLRYLEQRGNNTHAHLLTLNVTQAMVPASWLVVYHVLHDGEIVSDALMLYTEEMFHNKVHVQISAHPVPGEDAGVIVEAEPGSVVGMTVSETPQGAPKRTVLNSGNTLSPDMVFEEMMSYGSMPTADTWTAGPYDPSILYSAFRAKRMTGMDPKLMSFIPVFELTDMDIDASTAFQDSGLMVFTDLRIHHFRKFGMAKDKGKQMPRRKIQQADFKALQNEHFMPQDKDFLIAEARALQSFKHRTGCVVRDGWTETPTLDSTGIFSSMQMLRVECTGEGIFKTTIPDKAGRWTIHAVALHPEMGLGIADPVEFMTRKNFSIDLHAPISVTGGEEVVVTASVCNHVDDPMTVMVSLAEPESLTFLSPDLFKSYPLHIQPHGKANYSFVVNFLSTARGRKRVDVLATHRTHAERMSTEVDVVPAGITMGTTRSVVLCPSADKPVSRTLELLLPPDRGNEEIILTSVGYLVGSALNHMEEFVRLPADHGEVLAVRLFSISTVLSYLLDTGQVSRQTEARAVEYLAQGYQQLMRYRQMSGAFSIMAKSAGKEDLRLTAFVIRTLSVMQRFVPLDSRVIAQAAKWLLGRQKDDGSLSDAGSAFNRRLESPDAERVVPTALVVIALLEANLRVQYESAVSSGLAYLSGAELDQPYPAALTAYALGLAGHPSSVLALKRLGSHSIKEDDTVHWESDISDLPIPAGRGCSSPARSAANVETTAFAVLAHAIHPETEATSQAAVRWLATQMSGYGGFSSTQDTAIALQALAAYGLQDRDFIPTDVRIFVRSTSPFHHQTLQFGVSSRGRSAIVSKVVSSELQMIEVEASGQGCALFQMGAKYQKLESDQSSRSPLQIRVTAKPVQLRYRKKRDLENGTVGSDSSEKDPDSGASSSAEDKRTNATPKDDEHLDDDEDTGSKEKEPEENKRNAKNSKRTKDDEKPKRLREDVDTEEVKLTRKRHRNGKKHRLGTEKTHSSEVNRSNELSDRTKNGKPIDETDMSPKEDGGSRKEGKRNRKNGGKGGKRDEAERDKDERINGSEEDTSLELETLKDGKNTQIKKKKDEKKLLKVDKLKSSASNERSTDDDEDMSADIEREDSSEREKDRYQEEDVVGLDFPPIDLEFPVANWNTEDMKLGQQKDHDDAGMDSTGEMMEKEFDGPGGIEMSLDYGDLGFPFPGFTGDDDSDVSDDHILAAFLSKLSEVGLSESNITAMLEENVDTDDGKTTQLEMKSQKQVEMRSGTHHGDHLVIETCVRWDDGNWSNPAVLELEVFSGFTADVTSLHKLMTDSTLPIMHFNVEQRKVTFILSQLKSQSNLCFEFLLNRQHLVGHLQPASATVYDFYEPSLSATTVFQPPDDVTTPICRSGTCHVTQKDQYEGLE
ncbi:alpha-1-inhibitor 3-like [Branchiostoma floridae x Branchiostoma belcheri]